MANESKYSVSVKEGSGAETHLSHVKLTAVYFSNPLDFFPALDLLSAPGTRRRQDARRMIFMVNVLSAATMTNYEPGFRSNGAAHRHEADGQRGGRLSACRRRVAATHG